MFFSRVGVLHIICFIYRVDNWARGEYKVQLSSSEELFSVSDFLKPAQHIIWINNFCSCHTAEIWSNEIIWINFLSLQGLPLHLQIDTYEDPRDTAISHRGYCQIKVFCDKVSRDAYFFVVYSKVIVFYCMPLTMGVVKNQFSTVVKPQEVPDIFWLWWWWWRCHLGIFNLPPSANDFLFDLSKWQLAIESWNSLIIES